MLPALFVSTQEGPRLHLPTLLTTPKRSIVCLPTILQQQDAKPRKLLISGTNTGTRRYIVGIETLKGQCQTF